MKNVLTVLQVPAVLMVSYLNLLSLAALFWRRLPRLTDPRSRFAILIPAHNEELQLPRLLDSIDALDYPRTLYDVYVAADNCTDGTAACAARAGAIVYERDDTAGQGKGFALQWLLRHVQASGRAYDAYVILDADSVASPNFLRVMNTHLVAGAQAMQSYYGVLNSTGSRPALLRSLALGLFNGLRPRGRAALSLSAGLHGNGMCFSAKLIERVGWNAFTLAEDVDFHLQLVAAGIPVVYAGEASVLAEMPTSFEQAHSQNVRWERGRLQLLLQTSLPRHVVQGIRRRDSRHVIAVLEQFIPPLSVLVGFNILALIASAVLHVRAAWYVALLTLAGQLTYIAGGLILIRASYRVWMALLWAPWYLVWKIWIYIVALSRLGNSQWIRTDRLPSASVPTRDRV